MNKGLIHAGGWAGLLLIGILALGRLTPAPIAPAKPAAAASVEASSAEASSVSLSSASESVSSSAAASSSLTAAVDDKPTKPLSRAGRRCQNRLTAVLARRGVRYDFDAYELTPEGKRTLRQVYRVLQHCPADVKLIVSGYSDNIGSDEQNRLVSAGRAVAAMNALTAQGWPDDMIEARGLGSTDPVASNASAAGRKKNRRIVLTLSAGT